MKFAERKKLIDRQSFVAQYISLAILAIGKYSEEEGDSDVSQGERVCWEATIYCQHLRAAVLLPGSEHHKYYHHNALTPPSGFFNKATEDAVFSNVIDLLFNCAAFIYIGAIIPFDTFNDTSVGVSCDNLPFLPYKRDNSFTSGVWCSSPFASYFFVVYLSFSPSTNSFQILRRFGRLLLRGGLVWSLPDFHVPSLTDLSGPMGVGAIFIGTLARTMLPDGQPDRNAEQVEQLRQVLLPIISFLVLSSVITRKSADAHCPKLIIP